MYQCPYCGKELTADDVFVDMTTGCRLGSTEHRVNTSGGKKVGEINWDGLLDVTNDSEQNIKFTCIHCEHELSQEEVEDLILINSKETK